MTHIWVGGLHEPLALVLLLGTPVPPAHLRPGRVNVRGNGDLQLCRSGIWHVWNRLDFVVPVCPVRVVLETVSGQEKT